MRDARYDRAAHQTSLAVLRTYSTSFGAASRLLGKRLEADIAAVYAMVRIADEIVDGVAEEAGLDHAARREALDAFETAVLRAVEAGWSSDLVLHAFAGTARRCGIDEELVAPFFASMRTDLEPVDLRTREELDAYVYGSAEVVGLMCLQVFINGSQVDPDDRAAMQRGARALGSAFQLVNFVRDLGEDHHDLGRRYLPELDPEQPSEEGKHAVLDRIDDELSIARETLDLLPRRPRMAVGAALGMFAELSTRLREVPAAELVRCRTRVPDPVKARIFVGAALLGIR